MGRRKIEIKAIKDDRNRSVTFLKRKGGLFKKAHELSVLCSVDVAVIIFGNNKKLYEYSSSDIGEILTRYQYYGGANEHKGPADFTGKGKDMDDDDDDDGSGPSHHGSEPPQMMPPHQSHPYPNQPFHQMRQVTPSASPPINNGAFPIHPQQQRQHTPQPQQGSRPSSRNGSLPRRQSSLVPLQHQQQHPQHNGFAYHPQPAIYNPQQTPPLPPHHGLPQHMQQGQPMQAPPQGMQQPGPPPQYPNYGPPPQQQQHQQQPQHPQHPQQQQMQQMYMEEQRRASVPPPNYPQQDQQRPPSRQSVSPPQPQSQQIPQHPPPPPQIQAPPPQQEQERHQEQQPQPPPQQQMLEPVKRLSVKSRSIFTPIDESRSILSQHWASSTSNAEPIRSPPLPNPNNRSQSMDVEGVARVKVSNSPPPPARANTHTKNRVSVNSVDSFTPPSRTNSAQMGSMKRPVLKVHIPAETDDENGNTPNPNSDPQSSADATSSNPQQNSRGSDSHSGVVLPPPSPSASALLSAGASGPPNPFARPHHPVSQPSQNSNASNSMIDTPVSALPSRFMNGSDFLPSPSSFYPEWAFGGRGDSNTLPSPLNFATPVVGSGPSFLREDSGDRGASNNGNGKRKTPDADEEDGGDSKRPKME